MNTSTRSIFLKEMGITEWAPRDALESAVNPEPATTTAEVEHAATAKHAKGIWWFFGSPLQEEAQMLFQSIIRALGLSQAEWVWKNPADSLAGKEAELGTLPVIAFAFGGSVAQKLSGERDPLPQLRETVLGMQADGYEEVPLIASFEFNQLLARPKDKALLWQDLILARSVLNSL
jgi:uracil-DNA glycosylase